MPLGRNWRSSPLVFSQLPRCHGLCGSQKYTRTPMAWEFAIAGYLPALVVGERLAQEAGHLVELGREGRQGRQGRFCGGIGHAAQQH